MKIKLEKNEKQVALLQAMGSKNRTESLAAQEVFAELVAGKVVDEVLSQSDTTAGIFQTIEYDESSPASIPFDLFEGDGADTVKVWSQSIAGGLPSSLVTGMKELKFDTYTLESGISFLKKYARAARLDVVSKGLERMANEILFKQITNRWAVVLNALATATTNGLSHVIASTAPGRFQLDDLNRLMTRNRRLNSAWTSGTPVLSQSRGVTDLFISPEVLEDIRAFAYQPMNTVSGAVASSGATSVALPDGVRENIFQNAGTQAIYGVVLHELLELGAGQAYNTLFDEYFTGTFVGSTADLVIGVDATRDALFRPVVNNGGGAVEVMVDDQFVARQEKIGFWSRVEEGALCATPKPLTAVTIAAT